MKNEEMRELSGNKVSKDALTQFFYLLLRDGLPAGKVEAIIENMPAKGIEAVFTNGWIAGYAENLAKRLKSKAEKKRKK